MIKKTIKIVLCTLFAVGIAAAGYAWYWSESVDFAMECMSSVGF